MRLHLQTTNVHDQYPWLPNAGVPEAWLAGNEFQHQDIQASFGPEHPTVPNVSFNLLNDGFPLAGLIQGWAQNAEEKQPIFAVISNNRAHHVSYLLAKYARWRTGASSCTILNIDQHQDWGSSNTLQCGTWGAYWKKNLNTEPFKSEGTLNEEWFNYISYANGRQTPFIYTNSEPGKAIERPYNIQNILSQVENLYVTIDLDVLMGDRRTEYQAGILSVDDLENIISQIKTWRNNETNKRVIGADVVGLPMGFINKKQHNYKQYIDETRQIIECLCDAVGL